MTNIVNNTDLDKVGQNTGDGMKCKQSRKPVKLKGEWNLDPNKGYQFRAELPYKKGKVVIEVGSSSFLDGNGDFGQKRRENFDNNMKIDMSNTATRFELGTPHFPNIFALNAAVRHISKIGIRHIEKRILNLTEYLTDNLQNMKLQILSPIEERKYRSGIILFKARNKKPVDIVMELEKRDNIIVSARGKGIRVSAHFYNNEDDIDKLIVSLKRILQ